MRVSTGYAARDAFHPLHMRAQRFGVVVAHRRAGKTVAAINDLIDAALRCERPDPRFAYVAPFYRQAKDVAWLYLKRYTAAIPGAQANESELRIDFPGGARVRLYGADNYDTMRGVYFDGVVLDEFADMHPAAWSEVIRPALADRRGWALFIGTPKGRNTFCELYERAVDDPDWFALRLRASETGLLPQEELDALRKEMSANEYQREMETDFDAAIEGAYYADLLRQAEAQGRVGAVSADPLMQLRAYCDIGGTGRAADAFAMWVVQFVGREIRVLDHYEAVGQEFAEHVHWLRERGFERAEVVLPHDGLNHEKIVRMTPEGFFRSAGFKARTRENVGSGAAKMRIEAARRVLPSCWFNAETTKSGRAALAWYHEKRDEKRNVGQGPEHDWASHSADAFGEMALDYEAPQPGKGKKPERNLKWVV